MATVRSKDGTSIAFDKQGSGPALILVDGALCSRTMGPSASLAALLKQHFTVYTYDRRGRGESGDTAPYSVKREVEDIDALVQDAGGSAFVWGMSSGGALVLEAANRLPGSSGSPSTRCRSSWTRAAAPWLIRGIRSERPSRPTSAAGRSASS